MNSRAESAFFRVLENVLEKGYSLHDSLTLIDASFSKQTRKIGALLNEGYSFSEAVDPLKFSKISKEMIRIGEKSNKLNQAVRNINEYFDLKLKLVDMINKILIYPILVFTLAFICFIFIERRVVPIIEGFQTLGELSTSDQILHFIAFQSLKLILGTVVVLIVLHKVAPHWFNVIPIVKLYRSLYLCTNILLIMGSGASLEESIDRLAEFMNKKVYQFNQLKSFLIIGTSEKDIRSCIHPSFSQFIKMGISANNLNSMLCDFKLCYTRILFQKLGQLVQTSQFFIFIILSINIFLIYYIIMMPMINLSGSI